MGEWAREKRGVERKKQGKYYFSGDDSNFCLKVLVDLYFKKIIIIFVIGGHYASREF